MRQEKIYRFFSGRLCVMDVDKIIKTWDIKDLRNEYIEIPELNFGGFDWNQTVSVAHNRLFLITEYDKVRMIYIDKDKT